MSLPRYPYETGLAKLTQVIKKLQDDLLLLQFMESELSKGVECNKNDPVFQMPDGVIEPDKLLLRHVAYVSSDHQTYVYSDGRTSFTARTTEAGRIADPLPFSVYVNAVEAVKLHKEASNGKT